MAKVDPTVGRKILETVRNKGGHVEARSVQQLYRMTGVSCSMRVFKRELAHQARAGGKLIVTKPGTEPSNADPRMPGRLVVRLAKQASAV